MDNIPEMPYYKITPKGLDQLILHLNELNPNYVPILALLYVPPQQKIYNKPDLDDHSDDQSNDQTEDGIPADYLGLSETELKLMLGNQGVEQRFRLKQDRTDWRHVLAILEEILPSMVEDGLIKSIEVIYDEELEKLVPKSASDQEAEKPDPTKFVNMHMILEDLPVNDDGSLANASYALIRETMRNNTGAELGFFTNLQKICDFCGKELPMSHITFSCELTDCGKSFDVCAECTPEREDKNLLLTCFRHDPKARQEMLEKMKHRVCFEFHQSEEDHKFGVRALPEHSTLQEEANDEEEDDVEEEDDEEFCLHPLLVAGMIFILLAILVPHWIKPLDAISNVINDHQEL